MDLILDNYINNSIYFQNKFAPIRSLLTRSLLFTEMMDRESPRTSCPAPCGVGFLRGPRTGGDLGLKGPSGRPAFVHPASRVRCLCQVCRRGVAGGRGPRGPLLECRSVRRIDCRKRHVWGFHSCGVHVSSNGVVGSSRRPFATPTLKSGASKGRGHPKRIDTVTERGATPGTEREWSDYRGTSRHDSRKRITS